MFKKRKSIPRRAFLLGLGVLAVIAALVVEAGKFYLRKLGILSTDDLEDFSAIGTTSLKDRAAEKDLIYGAFVQGNYETFSQDQKFQAYFINECQLLVAGFYWNWGGVRPTENSFNFADTDNYAEFTAKHNLLLRGHPLIWYRTSPEWLVNKFIDAKTTSKEIEQILINHVSTVVKRYAGKVHFWDVVNEAIYIKDGRDDGFRDTKISGINGVKCPSWFDFLGKDFIDLAFRTAAEADSQATLIYNDNYLNYDIPNDEAKRNAVLNLLRYLKAKSTPVHALGIQAHLIATENDNFNPQKFRQFLKDVADLDLKIIISELDVRDRFFPGDIKSRDRAVARAYSEFLSVALDEPAVIAVATWGLSDRYSWTQNKSRPDGSPQRPLPLDTQLNRKLAWNAIAKAFDNAPKR